MSGARPCSGGVPRAAAACSLPARWRSQHWASAPARRRRRRRVRLLRTSPQTPPQTKEGLQAQYNDLFQKLLKDPTNVDLTFQFADVATKIGNYESAISALERLLLYDPDFPEVKLELAELYLHIGSYDVARVYLKQAQQEPNMPLKVVAREKAIEDELNRQSATSRITASVLAGARYQTNANAGPAGANIIVGGVPSTLSSIFARKSDWDVFFDGNMEHSYDLSPARNAKLETNVLVYYSKQIRLGQFDSASIEVNSGPRFDMGDGEEVYFRTRPYILANEVLLGNEHLFWTVGGGIEVSRPITKELKLSGNYEFRSEHFSYNDSVGGAPGLSGGVHAFTLGWSYNVLENGSLSFDTDYAIDNARVDFNASHSLEFRLSYSQSVSLPWHFPRGPLVLTPEVDRIYAHYDQPDPGLDPTRSQVTQEWRYGLSTQLGLTESLAASVRVVRELVDANIPISKYNNSQVIFGLLWSY